MFDHTGCFAPRKVPRRLRRSALFVAPLHQVTFRRRISGSRDATPQQKVINPGRSKWRRRPRAASPPPVWRAHERFIADASAHRPQWSMSRCASNFLTSNPKLAASADCVVAHDQGGGATTSSFDWLVCCVPDCTQDLRQLLWRSQRREGATPERVRPPSMAGCRAALSRTVDEDTIGACACAVYPNEC